MMPTFWVNASAPGLGQGWSRDVTALDVEIEPTLWQQLWVRLLFAAALLLLFAGLFGWRIGHLRRRARELETVVDQRTQDLREQTERLLEADKEKTMLLGRLQEQSEAFERQAREDALTGLANRRSLNEELARAFDASIRHETPLCFALLDLDHFKRINDTYSHLSGDRALVAAAKALQAEVGGMGQVARWGGEEFAVLFEGTGLADARACCERARRALERVDCSAFAPGWKMTISSGVAERTGLAHYERLVSRADALLYQAKREGRNRVCG